jgi:hypothetical protein
MALYVLLCGFPDYKTVYVYTTWLVRLLKKPVSPTFSVKCEA